MSAEMDWHYWKLMSGFCVWLMAAVFVHDDYLSGRLEKSWKYLEELSGNSLFLAV